jgi:hypothetical protein
MAAKTVPHVPRRKPARRWGTPAQSLPAVRSVVESTARDVVEELPLPAYGDTDERKKFLRFLVEAYKRMKRL